MKKKILIVDDNVIFRLGLKQLLSEDYDVYDAAGQKNADSIMTKESIDLVLIDINLAEGRKGIAIASGYKERYPAVGLILMSVDIGNFETNDAINAIVDDKLEKGDSLLLFKASIERVLFLKNMPLMTRLRLDRVLGQLSGDETVDLVKRLLSHSHEGKLERLDGRLQDGKNIRWVCYHLLKHGPWERTIGVACGIGCGSCTFCGSGEKPFERPLSVAEIKAQVAIGLQSAIVLEALDNPKFKLTVNITCECDSLVFNFDYVVISIEEMSKIREIEFNFIITTIGGVKRFTKLLDYAHLPRTSVYFSLNYVDEAERKANMRFVEGGIGEQLDLLQEFHRRQCLARKDKVSPITISFIINRNNVSDERFIEKIVQLFVSRPRGVFAIKLMPRMGDPKLAPDYPKLELLCAYLQERGLECRDRDIIGEGNQAGCGSTVATQPDDF